MVSHPQQSRRQKRMPPVAGQLAVALAEADASCGFTLAVALAEADVVRRFALFAVSLAEVDVVRGFALFAVGSSGAIAFDFVRVSGVSDAQM